MQNITSRAQLRTIMYQKIIYGLLTYLSLKTVQVMRDNIGADSSISTATLQEGVTFLVNKDGSGSTIYIDYGFVQGFAREPEFSAGVTGSLLEWGNFTNTFDGVGGSQFSSIWNNKSIAFNLAKWLQYGGNGEKGNQPIHANAWFTKTYEQVSANLHTWILQYLKARNLI